ncbi:hypothetical protein JCGZ_08616 [Jatropha curcas]|uniref:Uncharacterized protein n=1 Tax=Jatropha curcas TaxID=180498 RepID=A0A067KLG3_JATCU|nr:hypothetical protein JCGZ_08616 [Jatropha curcas]
MSATSNPSFWLTFLPAAMSKEKKKSNKQLTSPNHNPNLSSDLPQQLLYQLERKPSLMQEIYSKGATKSWITEPGKCSKSSNATLPWLEVSTDNENSQNRPHTFNISFRSGSYSYRSPQCSPVIEDYHFLGCSYGLLISKGDLDYKLWDPIDNGWWHLPLWDNRIPFLCTALSSMPMIDNKKNKSTLIVLTVFLIKVLIILEYGKVEIGLNKIAILWIQIIRKVVF